MTYFNNIEQEARRLAEWLDLAKEQGADTSALEAKILGFIAEAKEKAKRLQPTSDFKYIEPDELEEIRALRNKSARILPLSLTDDELYDRILGAWLGRCAGCVLGAPVEGRDREFIKAWAHKLGQRYPLDDYWMDYPGIPRNHYTDPIDCFVKRGMDHVGSDDDLAYTVLGLLILEDYGIDFTTEDVGAAWLKYLPMACTAEEVALENLKKDVLPAEAAEIDNPFIEWIGADIRSDPWGYAAPGLPELAAQMAYKDAYLSHRRNGVYGAMFFSAVIAAALTVSDMRRAVEIGAAEIPNTSRLYESIVETVEWVDKDKDWERTCGRIYEKYRGMSICHTFNNTAITVSALLYSDGDFERAITLAVMGGIDTDCNGATAGSILGAAVGSKNIPKKWIEPFNDRLTTYLINSGEHRITDLARRTWEIAKKCRARFG